jgi:hypothetical protein
MSGDSNDSKPLRSAWIVVMMMIPSHEFARLTCYGHANIK